MKKLEAFEGKESGGWLYRITTNHCLNLLQSKRRRQQLRRERVLPAAERRSDPKTDATLAVRWLLANAEERQARCAAYAHLNRRS